MMMMTMMMMREREMAKMEGGGRCQVIVKTDSQVYEIMLVRWLCSLSSSFLKGVLGEGGRSENKEEK